MAEYYVPEKSEFHEGFIFEYREEISSDEWNELEFKQVMFDGEHGLDWFKSSGHKLIPTMEHFRVKHLDHDDIIELGGELMHEEHYNHNKLFHLENHSVILNPKNGWCVITVRSKERQEDYTAFVGTIKNKSELRRILKQVGVIQ